MNKQNNWNIKYRSIKITAAVAANIFLNMFYLAKATANSGWDMPMPEPDNKNPENIVTGQKKINLGQHAWVSKLT